MNRCRPIRDVRALAMPVIAALALLWQALVVQTHVHGPGGPGVAGTAAAIAAHAADPHRPADDPATCPACRALAQGGVYLTPAAAILPAPPPAFVALATARAAAATARGRRPAWWSRGPPGARAFR